MKFWLYQCVVAFLVCMRFLWNIVRLDWMSDSAWRRLSNSLGFGFKQLFPKSDLSTIWIHAVSLGESMSIRRFVSLLRGRYNILITVGEKRTLTIISKKSEYCGEHIVIRYFPWDLVMIWSKVLKQVNPSWCFFVEMEIWPGFAHVACRDHFKIALIGGRLPFREFCNYMRFKTLFEECLNVYQWISTSSKTDAERFRKLTKTIVYEEGSLKWDVSVLMKARKFGRERNKHGVQKGNHFLKILFIGAWSWEEDILLKYVRCLRSQVPKWKWLVAPRHPEQSLGRHFVSCSVKSSFEANELFCSFDVLWILSLGNLEPWFEIVDMVLIGGSLVPGIGGHSIMEGMRRGIPVVVGPFCYNIENDLKQFDSSGYVCKMRVWNSNASLLEQAKCFGFEWERCSKILLSSALFPERLILTLQRLQGVSQWITMRAGI